MPYKHLIQGIPDDATVADVFKRHQHLLQETMRTLTEAGAGTCHNVLMTKHWILMIPRRSKGRDSLYANGMGMMGMVWLKDQSEREAWTRFGMSDYLRELGVPVDW